jgi:hypothetical protein
VAYGSVDGQDVRNMSGGLAVLTVAKVTQGQAAGYAEYLEGKSHVGELGDYYLKDGERVEAPGRWACGAAAVGCNAEAPVSGEQLRALMAVERPDSGLPLRRAGATGEAVAVLDATFSAPKSVSAVWALAAPGGDPRPADRTGHTSSSVGRGRRACQRRRGRAAGAARTDGADATGGAVDGDAHSLRQRAGHPR